MQRTDHNNARSLLAHRACSSLADIGLLGLGLVHTLGKDLGVLILQGVSVLSVTKTMGARLTASSLIFSAWRRFSAIL